LHKLGGGKVTQITLYFHNFVGFFRFVHAFVNMIGYLFHSTQGIAKSLIVVVPFPGTSNQILFVVKHKWLEMDSQTEGKSPPKEDCIAVPVVLAESSTQISHTSTNKIKRCRK
jgi:hypothetical protein